MQANITSVWTLHRPSFWNRSRNVHPAKQPNQSSWRGDFRLSPSSRYSLSSIHIRFFFLPVTFFIFFYTSFIFKNTKPCGYDAAVNCGLLFASLVFGNHDDSSQRQVEVLNLALISFALTAVNIVCIYIASIVWFKIKEIAPFENKSDVWKCYVEEVAANIESILISANLSSKVVRHRTLKGEKAQKMKEMLKKELFSLSPVSHFLLSSLNI